MKIYVSSEHHFGRSPDGGVYSLTGGREYRFWQRYLRVFDEVVVVARVGEAPSKLEPGARADGPRVSFLCLPEYRGLKLLVSRLPQILRQVVRVDTKGSVSLLRVPGLIGSLMWLHATLRRTAYGLEVVADPAGVFAEGSSQTPFRTVISRLSTQLLRQQCAKATTVSYVTEGTLQRKYPPNPQAFSTHFSSVDLPVDAYVDAPRIARHFDQEIACPRIVTVGSLAQPYKGVDVLIEAVRICQERGRPVQLRVVGDGIFKTSLIDQASMAGVASEVHFCGQLSAQDVRRELDHADIFVLASRTEGLPRAMIEAMARRLPCVGTSVGGIPELLDSTCLVPPNNPIALADKILELLTSRELRNKVGERNFDKALQYRTEILDRKRTEFYSRLKERALSSEAK